MTRNQQHGGRPMTMREIMDTEDGEQQPADQGRGVESRESRMVVIERNAEGTPTIWCDPEIVDLVTALNAGGIPTVASCSGHGAQRGNIALRDGRELHISPDFESARTLEAAIAALTQPKGEVVMRVLQCPNCPTSVETQDKREFVPCLRCGAYMEEDATAKVSLPRQSEAEPDNCQIRNCVKPCRCVEILRSALEDGRLY